jgi:hypothetical protein
VGVSSKSLALVCKSRAGYYEGWAELDLGGALDKLATFCDSGS